MIQRLSTAKAAEGFTWMIEVFKKVTGVESELLLSVVKV